MTSGGFFFLQLLSRKTNSEAEELERNIFGPKRVIIVASAEQGENRVIREDEVLQGIRTLETQLKEKHKEKIQYGQLQG